METKTVEVRDAEKRLKELLALVAQASQVVLSEDNTPVARLVPISQRIAGLHKGANCLQVWKKIWHHSVTPGCPWIHLGEWLLAKQFVLLCGAWLKRCGPLMLSGWRVAAGFCARSLRKEGCFYRIGNLLIPSPSRQNGSLILV